MPRIQELQDIRAMRFGDACGGWRATPPTVRFAPRPPRDGAPWPRCRLRQRRCRQHPFSNAAADEVDVRTTRFDPAPRRVSGCGAVSRLAAQAVSCAIEA